MTARVRLRLCSRPPVFGRLGSGVPNDAGVISYLRQRGEIAPGAGDGPQEVTLYDDPDVHIFMNINGRFFGTSDGSWRR